MEFSLMDLVKISEEIDFKKVEGYNLEPLVQKNKLNIYVTKNGNIKCLITLSQVTGEISFNNCEIDTDTKIMITSILSDIIAEL